MNKYRSLIFITVILAVAIYLIIPGAPAIFGWSPKTSLGLDLVGGMQIVLEAETAETPSSEAMNTAVSIVENRVNALALSETNVQPVGDRRILVELPGLKDTATALRTVGGTGQLEFVDMSAIPVDQAQLLQGQQVLTSKMVADQGITTPITSTQVWQTVLTGADLSNALAAAGTAGNYLVDIEFTQSGSKTFAEYTSQHVGTVLAIVLDGVVISAPRIDSAITEGSGQISGSFTAESANALAIQLRYGALPVPLKVVETRTIGPSLGQDSLQKSQLAGIIGAVIVMLFMILYYRLPGVVASLAILVYGIITFALYRTIPVTLTLPGIAGFLLSTGSALDANILIFERIKEELRSGRALLAAVNQGFSRAWSSIRDSNIATLLTSTVLIIFGNQTGATIVMGFAITLMLGVVISLFTALVVTRAFMDLALELVDTSDTERWFGI